MTPHPTPPASPLITVAHAQALIAQAGARAMDCSFDLARPAWGEERFALGHLPGAVYAHLDRDLSGAKLAGAGRHPLPAPATLAARLRSWGIDSDSWVIVYDANEASFAARAWWLLRWLGHDRVRVLDGGLPAWTAAGLALDTGAFSGRAGNFEVRGALQATVAVAEVEALVAAGADAPRQLVDARAPDRYEGRNETIDPVGGHIPGALNRFWKHNLGPEGRFKDAATLRAEWLPLLGARSATALVAQCGSGVTACHNLLALEAAGLSGAALYPGSWSQWVSDPARPVATGPTP